MWPLVLVALAVVLATAVFFAMRTKASDKAAAVDKAAAEAQRAAAERDARAAAEAQAAKKKAKADKYGAKEKKGKAASHPLLFTSLKGHTKQVLSIGFTPDDKFLYSCSEDRTMRLWDKKGFKDKTHPYIRVNVELDHPTSAGFSTDAKNCIVGLGVSRGARAFHLSKRTAQVVRELDDTPSTEASMVTIDMCGNERFRYLIKCYRDTTLEILSLKGSKLHTIDTKMLHNSFAAIHPTGEFFACAGFTPDVKVWAVTESVAGQVSEFKQVMRLTGHKSGVFHFCFSPDGRRAATVSKDATWRLHDMETDWRFDGDCKCIADGSFPLAGSQASAVVALAPNESTIAVGTGNMIHLFGLPNGQLLESISTMPTEYYITGLVFDGDSQVVASSGTDKHVHLWHNRPGLSERLQQLEKQLVLKTKALDKERVQSEIDRVKGLLVPLVAS